jgi:hypothetical protein
MAKINVVTGSLAVVHLAGQLINLPRGAVLANEVPEEQVKHLIAVGLVEEQDGPEELEEAATTEVVELPEGDPTDKWKVDQLVAYADKNGIDLAGAKLKPEILALVAKTAPTGQEL